MDLKKVLPYAVIAAIIAGSIAVFISLLTPHYGKTTILEAGKQAYTLEVASTPAAREQGLSGRQSLPERQGMLFVFPDSQPECMWMKGMKFPLDIIWVNSHKTVTHVERSVDPNTYPKAFCPDMPARYIIELNAGTADSAGIFTGNLLKF